MFSNVSKFLHIYFALVAATPVVFFTAGLVAEDAAGFPFGTFESTTGLAGTFAEVEVAGLEALATAVFGAVEVLDVVAAEGSFLTAGLLVTVAGIDALELGFVPVAVEDAGGLVTGATLGFAAIVDGGFAVVAVESLLGTVLLGADAA